MNRGQLALVEYTMERGIALQGGEGLVKRVEASVKRLSAFPDRPRTLFAFDYDNTLISHRKTTSEVSVHGGPRLLQTLGELSKLDNVFVYVITARKSEGKLADMAATLQQLGFGAVLDFGDSFTKRPIGYTSEDMGEISMYFNGCLVGAGFAKDCAIAELATKTLGDIEEVYFFDDNVMNAYFVQANVEDMCLEEAKTKVKVVAYWIDLFSQRENIRWSKLLEFVQP